MRKIAILVLAAFLAVVVGYPLYAAQAPKSLPSSTQYLSTPTTLGDDSMKDVVVLKTNMGDIELELDGDKAPVTVENFLGYVKDGFYDGTIFHRVIGDFMIQGGGFTEDGLQKETKPPIKLEAGNGLSNLRYTVAMARTSNPDSATSQFFINVKDNRNLDAGRGSDGYAVFGKVVSGQDVVDKIKEVPTGTRGVHGDWPKEDVVIEKAYLKE